MKKFELITIDETTEYQVVTENDTYNINIVLDQYPESPREWDNLGTLVIFGKNAKDETTEKRDRYELQTYLQTFTGVYLPVYCYEHRGIAYSTTPFICRWDSGQVGYIFVTTEKLKEEFPNWVSNEVVKNAEEILSGEIETYSKWANGDVYGYEITNSNGQHIDSCWGYYTTNDAYDGAIDNLKNYDASIEINFII